MKVLFYISSLSLKSGGPSRSVPMMAKGLSESGAEVTLVTLYSNDMNTHALDGTDVNVIFLKNGFDKKKIEDIILNEDVDIVQLQSLWSLDYHKVAQICRKHKIPYIITPRGMLEPWSMNQKRYKKLLAMFFYQRKDLNHAACIYTTSKMEAQNVRKLGIEATISVIPNGISVEGYPCRTTLENVKKQVLFLSRIHIKKGIELLINAWSNIKKVYPDWTLLIVGNGEENYVETLKRTIEEKGLSDVVKIMPPVFGDVKVKLYQSSALFVLPSYSENFGMVIAEAMSSGVPVITTDNTPWEFLNETKTGWCIPLSSDNLEKSIKEALSLNPSILFKKGQEGSKIVNNLYDYKTVSCSTYNLYKWILEGGKVPDCIILRA